MDREKHPASDVRTEELGEEATQEGLGPGVVRQTALEQY